MGRGILRQRGAIQSVRHRPRGRSQQFTRFYILLLHIILSGLAIEILLLCTIFEKRSTISLLGANHQTATKTRIVSRRSVRLSRVTTPYSVRGVRPAAAPHPCWSQDQTTPPLPPRSGRTRYLFVGKWNDPRRTFPFGFNIPHPSPTSSPCGSLQSLVMTLRWSVDWRLLHHDGH